MPHAVANDVLSDQTKQAYDALLAGRLDEAEAITRRMLKRRSRDAVASYILGLALSRTGRIDEAAFFLRLPAQLPGAQRDCQCEYGRVLVELGKFQEGIDFLRRATQTDPKSLHSWEHLTRGLVRAGLFSEAVNAGEEGLRSGVGSRQQVLRIMKTIGNAWAAMSEASEAVKWLARAMNEGGRDAEMAAAWAYRLNYFDVAEPDMQTAIARITECISEIQPQTPPVSPSSWTKGSRPLKVGLISPELRNHPVARFLLPLISGADASRCTWFAYYTSPASDEVTRRIERGVHTMRRVASLTDDALAATIAQDGLDVLIDLAGWGEGTRVSLMSQRLAPLQLTYLGYPNRTGVPGVDVRLVDYTTNPDSIRASEWSAGCGAESLVAIPGGLFCWQPPTEADSRVPSRRRAGPMTFGSFNFVGKISGRCCRTWANVLNAVPDSRLIIKAEGLHDDSNRRVVLCMLERGGVDLSRVELNGTFRSYEHHLDHYNEVDVALDTFPYNGATTTCEALWMGVPVVTLEGSTHAGRVGSSILRTVGLERNICTSEHEYVRRAAELAADPAGRLDLRRTLRKNIEASTLCDGRGFAERFTATLETLVERSRHPTI